MEIISHLIIDDWHPEADRIRQAGLAMPFDIYGNYPGARTESHEEMRDYARNYLQTIGYPIKHWPSEYNGAFQLCTQEARTWIHSDPTEFAAVWFLTPNELCPEGHGTAFYRHTKTEAIRREGSQDPIDGFEEHYAVEGHYNRVLIYDARLFHASTIAGFGNTAENGRLTMTFFWS